MDRFYTITETADLLGLTPRTIRRMIKDRRLYPTLRVGSRGVRIPSSTIEKHLRVIEPETVIENAS